MSDGLRIRLDRTICDGFGACAKHAPDYFSLDDWGYAVLVGDGNIPERDRDAVQRALMDCPVHAIIYMGEHRPSNDGTARHDASEAPEPQPNTDVIDWVDRQPSEITYISVLTIGEIEKGITRMPASKRRTAPSGRSSM